MPPLSTLLRWPLRALKGILGWLLALVILFEEWGWEPLQRALARIGQLPGPVRWMERWMAWKAALLERVRASRPWRLGRQMRQQ